MFQQWWRKLFESGGQVEAEGRERGSSYWGGGIGLPPTHQLEGMGER